MLNSSPREFTSAIIISVYVPPSADAAVACDVIHSAVAQIQTQQPNAFIVITGDFNHVSLNKTLPTFHQYVDCPTRDYNTLDLKQMLRRHTVPQPPPLGRSDHNLVLGSVNIPPCRPGLYAASLTISLGSPMT